MTPLAVARNGKLLGAVALIFILRALGIFKQN